MQQTVALGVHTIKVAVVRDQRIGDALMPTQQSQVEGDIPIVITLVKLQGELQQE